MFKKSSDVLSRPQPPSRWLRVLISVCGIVSLLFLSLMRADLTHISRLQEQMATTSAQQTMAFAPKATLFPTAQPLVPVTQIVVTQIAITQIPVTAVITQIIPTPMQGAAITVKSIYSASPDYLIQRQAFIKVYTALNALVDQQFIFSEACWSRTCERYTVIIKPTLLQTYGNIPFYAFQTIAISFRDLEIKNASGQVIPFDHLDPSARFFLAAKLPQKCMDSLNKAEDPDQKVFVDVDYLGKDELTSNNS